MAPGRMALRRGAQRHSTSTSAVPTFGGTRQDEGRPPAALERSPRGQPSRDSKEAREMKALVYDGPEVKEWEGGSRPKIEAHGRHRQDGGDDHLRDRSAHPEGRRSRGRAGAGSLDTKGSADHRSGLRRVSARYRRPRDPVVYQLVRALPLLPAGHVQPLPGSEGTPGIGWIFGYMIDGTQAEYVRVPFAENSVYKIPTG